MKIEYTLSSGETIHLEVYDELGQIILDTDREIYNNNQTETRRHYSINLFEDKIAIIDASENIEEKISRKSDIEILHNAISKLMPSEKELLHNLYFSSKPMTQAEYAKILGVTENAIQLRLAKIKKKLKKFMM